jgi:hypothetical protein
MRILPRLSTWSCCKKVLVADNVLKPGAPLLLWRLFAMKSVYDMQILSVREFAAQ